MLTSCRPADRTAGVQRRLSARNRAILVPSAVRRCPARLGLAAARSRAVTRDPIVAGDSAGRTSSVDLLWQPDVVPRFLAGVCSPRGGPDLYSRPRRERCAKSAIRFPRRRPTHRVLYCFGTQFGPTACGGCWASEGLAGYEASYTVKDRVGRSQLMTQDLTRIRCFPTPATQAHSHADRPADTPHRAHPRRRRNRRANCFIAHALRRRTDVSTVVHRGDHLPPPARVPSSAPIPRHWRRPRAGVIHRDIKPKTSCSTTRLCLLVDVGIAAAFCRPTHLTKTGAAVGTWTTGPRTIRTDEITYPPTSTRSRRALPNSLPAQTRINRPPARTDVPQKKKKKPTHPHLQPTPRPQPTPPPAIPTAFDTSSPCVGKNPADRSPTTATCPRRPRPRCLATDSIPGGHPARHKPTSAPPASGPLPWTQPRAGPMPPPHAGNRNPALLGST